MIIGTDIQNQTIHIDDDARARHMYVIGATGTGKSVLLQNCIGQDLKDGNGLCFIDPHGDTARSVIGHLPEERKNDLIYIDLSDISEPIGLNFLTDIPKDMRPLCAQNFVAAFKHIYGDESWGPRMEYVFLMSVRTLMDANLTLLALPMFFHDQQFRDRIIDQVTDPYVRYTFWELQYPAWFKKFGPDLVSPIENKIGAVLSSPHLRAILSQKHNTINLRDIMDTQKVLIIALQKGQIGELAASLFGALLVSLIGQTALSRSDTPEHKRQPFALFCDEFQNYATAGFPVIMSEARKYKLSLILAHQDLSQVDPKITNAVFANCGTFISFRVGATDTPKLVKQFGLGNEAAFLDLANFHAWHRPLVNGAPGSTTQIKTFPPAEPLHDKTNELISYSRRRIGRHYDAVDREISTFLCAPRSKTNPPFFASNSTSTSNSRRKRKRS